MLDRILIAIVIVTTLYIIFKLNRAGQIRALKRVTASRQTTGENQLLYFSSAICSQCLMQERILKQIFKNSEFQDVTLQKYTIEDDMALARQWRVRTLPTTIVISKSGEVKHINSGLTSSAIMFAQLHKLTADNSQQLYV